MLEHLVGLVPHPFLFGEREGRVPQWAIAVENWTDVGRAFGTL
jgi:hypothetical protein